MKYRKKPIIIDAYKFGIDVPPDWFFKEIDKGNIETTQFQTPPYCEIKTLEGIMRAQRGDYIIKGIMNEIYPCKADIFELTYEEVK